MTRPPLDPESIDVQSPVFIIGGSRTGSEMLKTMLTSGPEIDLVDELFLMCPPWLHRDLQSNIREHVGKLDRPGALARLLDLLYSGKLYGWFWSVAERELDREMLIEVLRDKPLDLRTLFIAVMQVHAAMRGKTRPGAKFPLHYRYTEELISWFPSCKLIHTTRNPKAVLASQMNKYVRDDQDMASKNWLKFQHFVHINIQISGTARLHRKLSDSANYVLVRYEDVVHNPGRELVALCEFLGVDFDERMLQPKHYGSSYASVGGNHGVNLASLEKWRTSISPVTAATVDILHRSAFRVLGYE